MSSPVAPTVDFRPADRPLRGTARVPGDKSISHRLAIAAAVARGTSRIVGYAPGNDAAATLRAVAALGAGLVHEGDVIVVGGSGWDGLRGPAAPVDCGRSATTMRLLAGVLAGAEVPAVLTGDPQLLRRPMDRVAEPLRRMGAGVETAAGRPPVTLRGGTLRGIVHRLEVPSAQVKSAVLLAGLRASGQTEVVEPVPTRDHSERLLAWLGAPVERHPGRIAVRATDLSAFHAAVPGDPSSAAPLLTAAAVVPGSTVTVAGMGLNPTRTAFLGLLERMGAVVEVEPDEDDGPEPRGTVRVRHAPLRGVAIGADQVTALIDELPLVGVLAAVAEGQTEVRGAAELRVKESDRIAGLITGLRALGVDVDEAPDGFSVRGPTALRRGPCDARDDHRLAMAFAVAALVASDAVRVEGMDAVADSFPGFENTLRSLR